MSVFDIQLKMEKISMCRVCLDENMGLLSIVGTHLQEIYESLVLKPLETTDGRPVLACYICRARLKNCYELRESCLQSEELFTQMLSCNESEQVKLQAINHKKRLTVHNTAEWILDADNLSAALNCEVKVEPNNDEDINEHVLEKNYVFINVPSADSDKSLLITVKEEQMGYRTNDSTPKKPSLDVQRSPEDSISKSLNNHALVQETFRNLHEVTAADLTYDNKERLTSVPRSERVNHTCDTCQQCYSSMCELKGHVCLCSDVWKKDLSRENRIIAQTYTVQKLHQCNVCKKQFSKRRQLSRHMSTHTSDTPHECNICKKQFSQKRNLITHRRTHTGEKPYRCDICKEQFLFKCHLITHTLTHTGEKPYHCDICQKQFSRKSHLITHAQSHSGEKPYQCDICNKRFSRKRYLTTHARTHTGEKPYHCDICKKQFSRKSNLPRHMLTHTI